MNTRRTLVCALALALVALLACKKKADVTAGEAAEALQAAPAEHPAVDGSLGALPDGVLAIAAVKSIDDARALAKTVGAGLGPIVGEDLAGELTLPPDMEKLVDTTRPVFAVAAPHDGEVAGTVALPLVDEGRKKIEAALKAGAEPGAAPAPELAAFGIGRDGVVVIDGYVVRAQAPALLPAQRPLLEKAIASFQPAATLQVLVSGQTANELAAPVIAEARDEVVGNMRRAARFMPMMGDGMADFYGLYFDGALAVMGEVKLLDLRVGADEQRLRVELLATVSEDGVLRKLVAHGEKGGIASVGLLPPGSWGVFGFNLDPTIFAPLQKQSAAMLSGMMEGVPSSEIEAAFEDIYAVQTGDSSVAMYDSEGFPFAIAGAVLTSDGERYEKAMAKLSQLYLGWAESMIAKTGAAAPVDFSSWQRLAESASAFTSAMGIEMAVRADDDVAGMDVSVKWNSIGAMSGDPDAAKRNAETFGSHWEMGFGFGPQVAAIGLGPKGYDHAEKVLEGGFSFEDDAFQASMKRAAAHPFVVLWLDAGRAANAFAGMTRGIMMQFDAVKATEVADKLKKATPGEAFAFTMGGSGTTLQAVLDVPFAPIREFSALAGAF